MNDQNVKETKGSVGSLPTSEAARKIARIYHTTSKAAILSSNETNMRKLSSSDKTNNVANAIGSLGMILGAIKKPDGDQNTLTFAAQNDTGHVIVPYRTRCNGEFYAGANLDIIQPGKNSQLEFKMSKAFNPEYGDVYLSFAICAENGLSVDVTIHFCVDEDRNNIWYPYSLHVSDYGGVNFDTSQLSPSVSGGEILYAYAAGSNDNPSFGIALMTAVTNSHLVGITFTPWASV